jgi:hypothetical protein
MKTALLSVFSTCLFISELRALEIDSFIDRVDEALRVSAFDNQVRARLSGTFDLEAYHFTDAAPGLIDTTAHNLINPRLSLFLDAQAGSQLYFFAQLRVDRGFDPSDDGVRVGIDEYALRFTPWESGIFNLQAGKFATVVGNWTGRHLSWDNPFINAPLPYENVTAISDSELPYGSGLVSPPTQKTKYERVPLIWGPSYATGISIAGSISNYEYAVELKNAALSSRPQVWDLTRRDFSNPTVTGHLAYQPNQTWKFGVSASEGAYLADAAQAFLPAGHGLDDYYQFVLGQDVSFAWRHWQIWAEVYEVRFEVPRFGNADSVSYYIEAKYKFAPQLFAAIRWNQEFFSTIGPSNSRSWSPDISRIEAAVTHRFTAHTQVKVQYYLQDEALRGMSHTVATQFTVRF